MDRTAKVESLTFKRLEGAQRHILAVTDELASRQPRATWWEETFEAATSGPSIVTELFILGSTGDASLVVGGESGARFVTATEESGLRIECLSRGDREGRQLGLLLRRTTESPASTIQPIHHREGDVGDPQEVDADYDWMFFYLDENVAGFKWTGGNLELHRILLVAWDPVV
jgi:hypothetical protein